MKIEHIGIAIQNPEEAAALFGKLLGQPPYKEEEVPSEEVKTIFFGLENAKLELLQSLVSESAIDKFINRRGEGIHHIALGVENLAAEIIRLKALGFEFINEEPKQGADQKMICFLHPKSTHGVLVELCQDINQPSYI